MVDRFLTPNRQVGTGSGPHVLSDESILSELTGMAFSTDADLEVGLNLISSDFDIIVVNRVNERMHGKSMIELLGKKCYREFVKRDSICPGCPGVLALETGQRHHAELEGVRDDGTRYIISCMAYPVMGPDGKPIGFIEVEEDITDRKRAEKLNEVLTGLRAALEIAADEHWILREGLSAIISLEGIHCGSVYGIASATGAHTLIAQRGTPAGWLDSLPDVIPQAGEIKLQLAGGATTDDGDLGPRSPCIALVVPILARGSTVGKFVIGLHRSGEIPSTTRVAVDSIRQETGDAIGRVQFCRLERKAATELDTLLATIPVPVWRLDASGMVTLWNEAAERQFGWKVEEVLGNHLPFHTSGNHPVEAELYAPSHILDRPSGLSFSCVSKHGHLLECEVSTVPTTGALGGKPGVIVVSRLPAHDAGDVESAPLERDHERRNGFPRERFTRLLSDVVRIAHEAHPAETDDMLDVVTKAARNRGAAVRFTRETDGEALLQISLAAPREDAVSDTRRDSTDIAPSVLVFDHDPDARGVLRNIFESLGFVTVTCPTGEETLSCFEAALICKNPFSLVIAQLIVPRGLDGLALVHRMLKLSLSAKVIAATDWPLTGHQVHGFAGVLSRPFGREEIEALLESLALPARRS